MKVIPTHIYRCARVCVCTYTRVCVRTPVPPEPIAQSGAKRRAISLSCCAISQPGFLLTLLTSLTCHDQRGAFRVQRLTRTPGGGGRSITSTFIHLAFFYRFIPPSPLHHLTSSRPLRQKKEEKNSGSAPLNGLGTDLFRTLCAVIGAGATNSSTTCTSRGMLHPVSYTNIRGHFKERCGCGKYWRTCKMPGDFVGRPV